MKIDNRVNKGQMKVSLARAQKIENISFPCLGGGHIIMALSWKFCNHKSFKEAIFKQVTVIGTTRVLILGTKEVAEILTTKPKSTKWSCSIKGSVL